MHAHRSDDTPVTVDATLGPQYCQGGTVYRRPGGY